jgi:hypothetical protein
MNGNGVRQEQEKLTYDEWKHNGFRVLAGQHSHEKNRYGEAVFYRRQVEEDPYHNDPNTGGKIWHLIRPQKMN